MRRFLCLLSMLLVLTGPASADTLRTSLAVPERAELTLTTNTGLTTVVIDAEVEVPEVQGMRTYDYVPARFTEAQALALARALGLDEVGEVAFEPLTHFGSIYTDYTAEAFDAAGAGIPTSRLVFSATNYIWHGDAFGGEIHYRLSGTKTAYRTDSAIIPYGVIPETCRYTREEARQLALLVAAQATPGYALLEEGVILGDQRPIGDTPEEVRANWDDSLIVPTAYKFVFGRVIEGVPVTVADALWNPYDMSDGPDTSLGEYTPSLDGERIVMIVTDDGIQELMWQNPFAVGAVVDSELSGLLPFRSVLDIARNILPLKLLAFERSPGAEGTQVEIDRIVLGYAKVMKQGAPRRFLLVPVWDFLGVSQGHDVSYLTIDARTGLVIDRDLGY